MAGVPTAPMSHVFLACCSEILRCAVEYLSGVSREVVWGVAGGEGYDLALIHLQKHVAGLPTNVSRRKRRSREKSVKSHVYR